MKKNIKKLFPILIFLIIIISIILILSKAIKKQHYTTYEINKYKIEEVFKNDSYNFVIKKGKNTYFYTLDEKLNKNKRVIKNIKTINNNELKCIIPIYKDSEYKQVYCIFENKQVSLDYLIQTNNNDYKEIAKKIKKEGIKVPTDNAKKKKYKEINIYQENFQNEHLILWNYKGIYVINKDDNQYQKVLKKDLYDNIMSCIVDKYYVLFDNSSVNGIENIYYYDLKKHKLNTFKLEKKLSKNTYINGVIDNLIYVTDKKSKIEYSIDIRRNKINEVDNNQTEYILYKNNKKKILSKSDFLIKEQYFNDTKVENKELDCDEIKNYGNYYYCLKDGDLLKITKNKNHYSTTLFHMYDIKDWFVIDNNIYIVKQDSIYSYSENNGMKKLIEYNELRYNYKNVYKIWKKK